MIKDLVDVSINMTKKRIKEVGFALSVRVGGGEPMSSFTKRHGMVL